MNFARCFGVTMMAAVIIGALMSCSRPSQTPTPYTAMEFQMDSSLLGLPLEVASLQLRVPANWVPADSSMLAQARAANQLDTSQANAEIKSLYLDSLNGSILLARTHGALGTQSFRDWASTRLNTFRAQRPGWQIREDWLLVNDLPTLQMFSMDSIRVYFSFLIDQSPPVELSYVVPSSAWQDQVHSIESSLGTITSTQK